MRSSTKIAQMCIVSLMMKITGLAIALARRMRSCLFVWCDEHEEGKKIYLCGRGPDHSLSNIPPALNHEHFVDLCNLSCSPFWKWQG